MIMTNALDHMLCFDTYAANLAFGRAYKPLLEPLGLTYPQYLVLLGLWRQDGRSVGDMGAELGLDSSTLTPLLKRLEGADLVTRQRDPTDERRVLVRLTERGRALEPRAAHIPGCIARLAGLTAADFTTLQAALRRLRQGLDGNSPSVGTAL